MTTPILLLIIDDDENYTRILKRRFEQVTDLQLMCFKRASEALKFTPASPVFGILLDMMMEDETGLDFVAPLQTHFTPQHLIIMTGYASIATTVTAIKRGATDYVAKPIAFKALLEKLGLVTGDNTSSIVPAPLTAAQLEWEHIQRVLTDHQGNITRAAEALGMHRRSLQRKLQKYSPLKQ
ncbi:response regulator [Aestuariibacter sp. GS-14]|uniref:response regulator transcription factor n=1 Tax=Alteromonadaceae TaxID=72275 RepID=UPI00112DE53B|nr:response regulator [Aestuariibacter sp. GS-14]TPV60819.1 response regulator [Aestuariibacter sp. GS-14]